GEICEREVSLPQSACDAILHGEACLHLVDRLRVGEVAIVRDPDQCIYSQNILGIKSVLSLKIKQCIDNHMGGPTARMPFRHDTDRFNDMRLIGEDGFDIPAETWIPCK